MAAEGTGADKQTDSRIAFFDQHAETWDDTGPNPAVAVLRMEELRDLIGLGPGCDVLEVGCGTGSLTRWLVEAVRPGRVTAIDFAPKMIAQAAAKGIDASFRWLDVCADDLGRRLYDVVLCFHSFPHFRDQAAALENLARALRPGGRLAIVHLRGSRYVNAIHASVGDPVAGDRLPDGHQWGALLTKAGLQCREFRDEEDGFLLLACRESRMRA